jgi:hypothetical protein
MFDNNYQKSSEQPKTFMTRAANDGAILGIIMSLIVVFMAYGTHNGLFVVIALVLMIAVPYLTYRFLKQAYLDNRPRPSFSLLWMQGINTFLCGGLILALTIFVCLRFVFPDFIVDQVQNSIDIYRSFGNPDMNEIADALQTMQDQKLLPTPISVAMTFMFMAVFTGSILSVLVSLIVRATTKDDAGEPTPPPFQGNNAN